MGILGNVFKKKSASKQADEKKHAKGFFELEVSSILKVTNDCVQVSFQIPHHLENKFKFIPGQYVNILTKIEGKEERRSYSICSGKNENLSIAIKEVASGKVSEWANHHLKEGNIVQVSAPEGNFTWNPSDKNIVSFAAGSGITPILAIAKSVEANQGKMKLFYANRTEEKIIFKDQLDALKNTETTYFLTQELNEKYQQGRLNKEKISEIIKNDLNLLKADAFFICGPEEMIFGAMEILKIFGVSKEKIHFELFKAPEDTETSTIPNVESFTGTSKVKVILDDEVVQFSLNANGKSILEAVMGEGFDPPYSCRGGVCCTCRAKVLSGSASMKLNYSLTDQEVKNGYILTCQAHPTSEELSISYDE